MHSTDQRWLVRQSRSSLVSTCPILAIPHGRLPIRFLLPPCGACTSTAAVYITSSTARCCVLKYTEIEHVCLHVHTHDGRLPGIAGEGCETRMYVYIYILHIHRYNEQLRIYVIEWKHVRSRHSLLCCWCYVTGCQIRTCSRNEIWFIGSCCVRILRPT